MSDQYVLLEHSSPINTIIYNTFQTTQRIKFTAFDVSSKYVVFGANSGGIYIFTREPSQFLKLIPSSHGATNLLKISPNEENLAIAVSTGLVIILEDFNSEFEQQIFSEHENHTVTALAWRGNDLFTGDSMGRVCLTTLKSFLTVFQTPAACLMRLDSTIVQMEASSNFLLVSTMTRTVLCDTQTENFRQVGKKMREGAFGACFSNYKQCDIIVCARPGLRLWEADFEANVLVTYQFRSTLPDSAEIIAWHECDELNTYVEPRLGDVNFCRVFSLDRFVVTFCKDGFYVFEPSQSVLLYWKNLSNIRDLRIVDSFFYVWHNDLEVSVFSLCTVEDLILKCLKRKKFKMCGDLCVKFYSEIERLLETSKNIYLLSALENKLRDSSVLEKLAPIFERLKEEAELPTQKLNGVISVNSFVPDVIDPDQDSLAILSEQFKISSIHESIETSDFTQLMTNLNSLELFRLLSKLQQNVPGCDSWCKITFLKYLKPNEMSPILLQYATEAFTDLNQCEHLSCKCHFPLPQAHTITPKYGNIFSILNEDVLKKVPSAYKHNLKAIDSRELSLKLSLVVQFSDPKVMESLLPQFTYDLWDEATRLLLKLKQGKCLHCGASIDAQSSLEWTTFGVFMAHSIKPKNAIKLLKRYSDLLPKGVLDAFFFQYCVLETAAGVNEELRRTVAHVDVKRQFEASVGCYLRKKFLRNEIESPDGKPGAAKCEHCHLLLKMPVLDQIRMSCGHCYHQECFLYNKKLCLLCGINSVP